MTEITPQPAQTITASDGTVLDAGVVNLAKAIRQHESGGNYDATGDAGTSAGAYQFNNGKDPIPKGGVPANFQGWAKQYGLDPADFSPVNQDKVAYARVKDLKDKGYSPEQVAAVWNGGEGVANNWQDHKGTTTINGKQISYDTPAYVASVMKNFQQAKGQTGQTASQEQPAQPQADPNDPLGGKTFSELYGGSQGGAGDSGNANPIDAVKNAFGSGTAFASSKDDSASTAALKTAGNLLPSAAAFAKGTAESLNPLSIIDKISQIPSAWEGLVRDSGGVGNALKALGSELLPTAADQVVPKFGRDLATGNTEAAQEDVVNNPFGSIAPFVFGARGAAGAVDSITGKSATANMADYVANPERMAAGEAIPTRTGTNLGGAMDKAVSAVTKPIVKPLAAAASGVASAIPSAARFAFGQATGLEPKTISTIADNPEAFSKANAGQITREALGSEVGSALQDRIDSLDESGHGYNDVRASEASVVVDESFLKDSLEQGAGVKVAKDGTIKAPAGSRVSNAGDVSRLQSFYQRWQPVFKKGQMTADQFLTMRQELAKISYNDAGFKSGDVSAVAEKLRQGLNTKYRSQIEGLEEKDADFSSQAQDLKNLRKGIIDKEGNLTDGAVNKIANATGKGKAQLLGRLEEIVPGITKKIQILKAAEDLERAGGAKTGTYTRSVLGAGGLIGGITTMNIPIIAASLGEMILSNPEVATTIIRTYGSVKPLMTAISGYLKKGANAINDVPKTFGAQAATPVFGRPQAQLPAGQ